MPEIVRSVDIPFLDGTTRTVLLNMSAKIEAEGAMPRADGTPTPFYELINLDGLTPLRALLWAGLRGADPTLRVGAGQLRLADVDALLEEIDSNELAVYLMLALSRADHHLSEDDRKNADRAAATTLANLREKSSTSAASRSALGDSATANSAS